MVWWAWSSFMISDTEVKQWVKEAVKEHLESERCNCPFSDEDTFVIRKFVKVWNGTTATIGTAILLGLLGGIGYLVKLGIEAWRSVGMGGGSGG